MAERCSEPDCPGYVPEREPPIADSMCLFHSEDPRLVEARNKGRSKGGSTAQRKKAVEKAQDLRPPSRPESFVDLASWVSWLIEATANGALSQSEADTLGKLVTRYRKLLPEVWKEQELKESFEELADNLKRLRSALERERQKNKALRSKIRRLEGASPRDTAPQESSGDPLEPDSAIRERKKRLGASPGDDTPSECGFSHRTP